MKDTNMAITPAAAVAATAAGITTVASLVLSFYWHSVRRRNDLHSTAIPHQFTTTHHPTSTTDGTKCIYLDYNATTPIDPRVLQAMLPYLTTHFGNPSSSHAYGIEPKVAIQKAREAILKMLHPHCCPEKTTKEEEQGGILFTGCGTEADNLAIHLAIQNRIKCGRHDPKEDEKNKCHIVTTNVEHPAVAQYLDALEKKGMVQVTRIPVNEEGYVTLDHVRQGIRLGETVLVTIMLANNESGALQPVKQVAEYCRKHGILFHTDAAQAVGKISVALDETGIGDCVDMMTIVGHKFGAPKGIACLYVRPGCLGNKEKGIQLESSDYLLIGGGQEGGKRGGTENVVR
jgi:cysteine desulfurase